MKTKGHRTVGVSGVMYASSAVAAIAAVAAVARVWGIVYKDALI